MPHKCLREDHEGPVSFGVDMPYEGPRIDGNERIKRELAHRRVDPGVLDRAVTLQWVYSSFSDPGPDWCMAKLYDEGGVKIGAVLVDGY